MYVVLNVSFIFQALTKFWRKLRPKTLSKDFLSHINFTILGLGDTNYNQFCNAPKKLRNRLKELGNIFIFIFMNWYGIYVNILTGVNCLFNLLIWTLFIGQFVKKEGRRWGKEGVCCIWIIILSNKWFKSLYRLFRILSSWMGRRRNWIRNIHFKTI